MGTHPIFESDFDCLTVLLMDDSLPQSIYSVKTCRKHRIITQNANGPCPALALYNALLLNGRLQQPTESGISAQELMDRIGNALISMQTNDEQLSQARNAALETFSSRQLLTGLDINVRFKAVDSFEFTSHLSVFDVLRIPILHCWVIGEGEAAFEHIKDLSYNQLVVSLCEEELDQSVKEWFTGSLSQATEFGFVGLSDALKNGQIAILFRNNHFFTLTKQHERLFTLVTDQGYLKSPDIMWEELTIDGGGEFFNEDFLSKEQVVTSDEAFARQLQEAELNRITTNNLSSNNQQTNVPQVVDYYQSRDQHRIQREREKKCVTM